LNEIAQFDEEMIKIEDEIIQFLIDFPLFIGQKSIFLTIQAYFITRGNLTQSELKELTGLSSGAISQELRKLIDFGLIEITKTTSTGKKIYSMKSVTSALLTMYVESLKDASKWEKELQEIKLKLEENKEELKLLNGYDIIYRWVNLFLQAMPLTKLIINLMEEEKAALEN